VHRLRMGSYTIVRYFASQEFRVTPGFSIPGFNIPAFSVLKIQAFSVPGFEDSGLFLYVVGFLKRCHFTGS
jgi:hypothetical protein